jgi:hypothetical protein
MKKSKKTDLPKIGWHPSRHNSALERHWNGNSWGEERKKFGWNDIHSDYIAPDGKYIFPPKAEFIDLSHDKNNGKKIKGVSIGGAIILSIWALKNYTSRKSNFTV